MPAISSKASMMPNSNETTQDTHPNSPDLSGHIAQLWIYPIKSCGGIRVPQALLTPTGLAHDREWMVVDLDGEFVTQRELPHMALIQPELVSDSAPTHTPEPQLRLTHPRMPSLLVNCPAPVLPTKVRVWDDVVWAHDQGNEPANWLSGALNQPVRLVRRAPTTQRQVHDRWCQGAHVGAAFADAYPLLVTTLQAQQRLQAALQGTDLAANLQRFRANMVLDGLEAHDEDFVQGLELEGGAHIQLAKPCVRCPIPNVDPQTALVDSRISQALSTYRQDSRMNSAITFGMNGYVKQGVGMQIREGQVFGAFIA
jgi:uncharacterized protein YcbX